MQTEQLVKILLVDDKKENLLSLEVILQNENYAFIKANSGREALKILLKEQDFALILMDVQMPMLDGFETAELIRQSEKFKHVPIIFLTANSNTTDSIFKGYKAGAVDYMLKPLVPEILKAKVAIFADLYTKTHEVIIQRENLKKLNKELKQHSDELARINEELEKFAYVASHDLQEPLRTITSYIQLLQIKYKDKLDTEGNEFMGFVIDASSRMRNIITDLLEYSRINRNKEILQPVDCNIILEEALENLHTSINKNQAVIQCDKLPTIRANRIQMVQLFQNLISNAIKFKRDITPEIKISSQKTGEDYLFAVQDNGIGIEQKYANKIFQIFQRLHSMQDYPGTGIGLAICKKIVQQYGGKIWMESEMHKGSTFYFTIKN
ncbi:MAG: response regulator [Bacteroidetes bacterium]|nr:response regulator [Bacteroidota bacterium]